VDVWDRLLRSQPTPADTTSGDHGRMLHTQRAAAHIAAMSGWLLAHSAPATAGSSSDGGNPMLAPATCRLVFSRLAEAVAGAAAPHDTGSTGWADQNAQWAPALYAAQGLAIVCWRDVRWFRQLLLEAQAVCSLLSATVQVQRDIGWAGAAGNSRPVAQSTSDLSVVSLPDESVYDISDSQSRDAGTRLGVQLLSTAMLLLHTSMAGADDDSRAGSTDTTVPRIVMQLCHARIRRRADRSESADSMEVLRELLASSHLAVASFSAAVTTCVLRWLLVCALCRDTGTEGICTDAHDGVALLTEWSVFVVQQLTDVDVAAEPELQSHARLVRSYRSCLAGAALAVGTRQASRDINAMAIRDGALECAMALVQMIATLEPSGNSSSGANNDT
ncbi:hypothetical protein H4R21_004016, partial [Coemansia helicoidea]